MTEQLVISAIGSDRPGLVNDLSEIITHHNGNIDDSRMTVLGGEFAIILLVSGLADDLDKLTDALETQSGKIGLSVMTRRTHPAAKHDQTFVYQVEVLAIDHPGIVYKLAEFFSRQNINILSLETDRYAAAHTGTPMFCMDMRIAIPESVQISALKSNFLELCDSMNLDASFRAQR